MQVLFSWHIPARPSVPDRAITMTPPGMGRDEVEILSSPLITFLLKWGLESGWESLRERFSSDTDLLIKMLRS